MKPRLFFGNFEFEHRLADPTHQLSAKLKQLNAELAPAWLAIAEDGDWIWTPSPIDPEFFHKLRSAGLPQVNPVTSLSEVPYDVEFVPWGWSAEVREFAERFRGNAISPTESAVKIGNSRATSEELERNWGVGLPHARRIESLVELKNAISSLPGSGCRWVVKAEFGMSARERILGHGSLKVADENWIKRRLDAHGVVFFEPWVERMEELGVQIEVPATGEPQLVGLTPMLVDNRGQYAGSWFAYHDSRFDGHRALWQQATEAGLRAARYLQSIGYFGPLGIDAMIYRDAQGSPRLRPLQDINARWTMGRVSLGWRRLLEPGDEAYWQHGPRDEVTLPANFDLSRTVTTGPEQIAGIPCLHRSQVLIGRTNV